MDEDQQEVIVDEPEQRDFFGFASMLEQTPHQTSAHELEESTCLEISRDDIRTLLERKPHAGMDLLTTLGRQLHAAQKLVRSRASRNPNDVIEEKTKTGERIADSVPGLAVPGSRNHDESEPQDAKDRLRGELDFEVNRRAEAEIQAPARKVPVLDEKFDDLETLLRGTKS